MQLGHAGAEAVWERTSDHYRPRALCGTDSGLQAYHDAAASGLWQFGAWVWRAPPGTVFTDVQANASLADQAGHRGELVVVQPGGALIGFGAEHDDFRVHSIHGEFTQFHSWLRCVAPGAGQPCGRAGGDSAHAYVRGVYLRTEDRAAPGLAISGGSLLGAEVVRGVRGLTFGAWRRRRRRPQGLRGGERDAAESPMSATAPSPGASPPRCSRARCSPVESAAVPTADSAFVTGPGNTVGACVEDLALDGAPNRVCERRRVWVDNACPASAVGGGAQLGAGFGDGGAVESLVASDRRTLIRGRLTGAGAGATVCALTRVLADGQPDRRRRDRDHRRRRLLRDRAPAGSKPRGLRPLRRRRLGDRAPRAGRALERAAGARRAPESRRPKPRPAPLLRHASGARSAPTGW